jgi:hypothetical protein
MTITRSIVLLPVSLVVVGCAPLQAPASPEPHTAFLANLGLHCGQAYPGRLTLEPPGDEMLTGTEQLVVHFRRCTPDRLELPFHIEKEADGSWDRSRTWVFMRGAEGLELRHDHRHADGTPEDNTWYGATTASPGTPHRQEFILADRRAPDGSPLGWRVEIVPGERYTYGTIRGAAWTWRVDFDLTRAVPAPPAPWGHQGRDAGP